MNDVYAIIGSLVVGWCLNSIFGWFKHAFWLGFKAQVVAQIKKGGPLTPEEQAAVKAAVTAQIQAEWNAKLQKIVGVLDDPTPPQASPSTGQ